MVWPDRLSQCNTPSRFPDQLQGWKEQRRLQIGGPAHTRERGHAAGRALSAVLSPCGARGPRLHLPVRRGEASLSRFLQPCLVEMAMDTLSDLKLRGVYAFIMLLVEKDNLQSNRSLLDTTGPAALRGSRLLSEHA